MKFDYLESFVASLIVVWWFLFNRKAYNELNDLYVKGMPLAEGFIIVLTQL